MIQLLKKHGLIYDQLPAILWATLIFVASSIPGITLPDLKFVPTDKVVHLLVYLVLCALIYRAFTYQKKFTKLTSWSLAFAVLLTILFGLTDEFHQSFVPNRVSDVLDLTADSAGAFLFWGYKLLRRRLSNSSTRIV